MANQLVHRMVICLGCGMKVGISRVGDSCYNCGEISSQASISRLTSNTMRWAIGAFFKIVFAGILFMGSLPMILRWLFS